MTQAIVSREEWLTVRMALLAREREMTHQLGALYAERRMPWVRIDTPYRFDGPDGKVTLGELFGDRSQLVIYHFMLAPGSSHVCSGCGLTADHIDAARQHFGQADLAFAAISRAPVERIEEVRRRMGWTFPWLSSGKGAFNHDFGVSFTDQDRVAGRAIYNYGTVIRNSPDMHGASIFVRQDGAIYHSYSIYGRGVGASALPGIGHTTSWRAAKNRMSTYKFVDSQPPPFLFVYK